MKESKPLVAAVLLLLGPVLSALGPAGVAPRPAMFTQGGPDGYGYLFIDNINETAGPSYTELWQDISTSGTQLAIQGDALWATIQPPMMVRFYGQNWGAAPDPSIPVESPNVGINSNGIVRLLGAGQSNTWGPDWNVALPDTTNPSITDGGFIALFWDDLYGAGANDSAQWQVIGNAPNRRLVIQLTNWDYYIGGGGQVETDMTIQIQISESDDTADSEIYFIYVGVTDAREGGDSATIGIQAPGGTSALQYSFNTANSTTPDTSTTPPTPRVIRFIGPAFVAVSSVTQAGTEPESALQA
ncbi:MAG: hypothetical protein HY716_06320, partial [Planctomycetes bacterium]|nr:hypothetical protein [Planctomycetota bacterium]